MRLPQSVEELDIDQLIEKYMHTKDNNYERLLEGLEGMPGLKQQLEDGVAGGDAEPTV